MKASKLTLEGYASFFDDPDRASRLLTVDQLNEIVLMHGFNRLRAKREIAEALRSLGMMRPARSTIGDRLAAFPCAPLAVEEVKGDVRTIGWEECPIGSILAVGPAADGVVDDASRSALSTVDPSFSTTAAAAAAIGKAKTKPRSKKKRRLSSLALIPI